MIDGLDHSPVAAWEFLRREHHSSRLQELLAEFKLFGQEIESDGRHRIASRSGSKKSSEAAFDRSPLHGSLPATRARNHSTAMGRKFIFQPRHVLRKTFRTASGTRRRFAAEN